MMISSQQTQKKWNSSNYRKVINMYFEGASIVLNVLGVVRKENHFSHELKVMTPVEMTRKITTHAFTNSKTSSVRRKGDDMTIWISCKESLRGWIHCIENGEEPVEGYCQQWRNTVS
ncbi:hypothetical protein ElyMa_003688900 [Elysia marginata]|uniref:PH domain-containing protein n=1 Tax=Elysia marginata TaxID=1093978 RepID=A0AAV4F159_9GAST|nr:hypothetical protein ElyMa_003688900 [Elysia marginata]